MNDQFGLVRQDASFVETIVLYGGEVVLEYEDDLHLYYRRIGNERHICSGVTSVIECLDKSGPLMQWAANLAVEHIINEIPCSNEMVRMELQGLYAMVKAKKDIEPKPYSLISVSTEELAKILRPASLQHNTVKKAAASIGKIAHQWLERHVKAMIAGVPHEEGLPDNPQSRSCVLAMLDWMQAHNFKPICSERKVYSLEYGFSGTLDLLGWVTACKDCKCCPYDFGTVLELVDMKTSNGIREPYFLQTAAYLYAMLEEAAYLGGEFEGIPDLFVDHRRIVRLGKDDGAFETKVRESGDVFEADFASGFLGLLMVYNWGEQQKVDRAQVRVAKKLAKVKPIKIIDTTAEEIPVEGMALVPAKKTRTRKKTAEIPVEGVA